MLAISIPFLFPDYILKRNCLYPVTGYCEFHITVFSKSHLLEVGTVEEKVTGRVTKERLYSHACLLLSLWFPAAMCWAALVHRTLFLCCFCPEATCYGSFLHTVQEPHVLSSRVFWVDNWTILALYLGVILGGGAGWKRWAVEKWLGSYLVPLSSLLACFLATVMLQLCVHYAPPCHSALEPTDTLEIDSSSFMLWVSQEWESGSDQQWTEATETVNQTKSVLLEVVSGISVRWC